MKEIQHTAETEKVAQGRLIPVARWDEHHAWPTPQGLRNRIHQAKQGNDAAFLDCILHVGGRVLVDEDKFFVWARKSNEAA